MLKQGAGLSPWKIRPWKSWLGTRPGCIRIKMNKDHINNYARRNIIPVPIIIYPFWSKMGKFYIMGMGLVPLPVWITNSGPSAILLVKERFANRINQHQAGMKIHSLFIHICIYIYIYTYVYRYTYIFLCVYVYIYVYIQISIYVCTSINIYMYTYMYTGVYTYIYIYT